MHGSEKNKPTLTVKNRTITASEKMTYKKQIRGKWPSYKAPNDLLVYPNFTKYVEEYHVHYFYG